MLQTKKRVTLAEIEDRFGLTRRTIFRDIRSIIDSGVPIGGDAGSGYFIVEGYHLPPVVFNKEEAAALLLSSKLIEKNVDSQTQQEVQAAMEKVKAVLRYSDKDFLDDLEKRVTILGNPAHETSGFPDSHLQVIQQALVSKQVIQMDYFANYSGNTTHREVAPLGLVYYSQRWHMIGYCYLRQAIRDFRSDRMSGVTITATTFNPDDHPDYLDFTHGMIGGTDALKANILFTKKVTRYIVDQKYYYGFVQEKITDDGVEMEFLTPNYEYLARWLLMFGNDATVIGPNELQGRIAALAKQSFDHHKKYFEFSEKPVT